LFWDAVVKSTVAYLPGIVSSLEGGWLSGVDSIFLTSPRVNGLKRSYDNFKSSRIGFLAWANSADSSRYCRPVFYSTSTFCSSDAT